MVCNAFDISRSSYYEYRQRRNRVDVERLALKARVNCLFTKSRSSAGSRTIKGMLNDDGVVIGRFKIVGDVADDACDYLNGVVVGLNWMYGLRGHTFALGSLTAAQRAAHEVIIAAAVDLHSRLLSSIDSREATCDGGELDVRRGLCRLKCCAKCRGRQK